jgi:dihydrofolate synthase / folylpolyglutamate synthase
VTRAFWPARMQRLRHGPLVDAAPQVELWLDGGHNPAGARLWRPRWPGCPQRETHLICGMLNTKDVRGYMRPLAPHVRGCGRVDPGEKNTLPAEATRDAARACRDRAVIRRLRWRALAAIAAQPPQARVLICGSLYLAGRILRENG